MHMQPLSQSKTTVKIHKPYTQIPCLNNESEIHIRYTDTFTDTN